MALGRYRRPINSLTTALLVAAACAAVLDWWAVERGQTSVEYLAKPATTALLIAAAAALDPAHSAQRAWFLAALVFCLGGDVFLMLPRDAFVAGLASFLVGHLCFLAGLFAHGLRGGGLVATALFAAVFVPLVARRVVPGARRQDPALVPPVLVYIAALGALVVLSGGAGSRWAIAGAVVFATSDSILAWNRFVEPIAHARLATMATYHGALALLVVALV